MTDAGSTEERASAGPRLRRDVGLGLLLFVPLGNMLGAGIYALVGEIGAEVGGAMWASFLLALTLAVFTAGAGRFSTESWTILSPGSRVMFLLPPVDVTG